MAALTPASPADLPPLGELVADDPFWRYPSAAMAGEGVAHLRVWLTTGPEPGHLAVVTETGLTASVTESAGHIWAALAAGTGPPSCCSSTTLRPSSARAWRPSIWSASAPMAARTGPACDRPWRTIPVTPGWSCGWPPTGTGSSAGPRASSTDARTTDRQTVTGIGRGRGARRQAQFHCPTSGAILRHNALVRRLLLAISRHALPLRAAGALGDCY